MNDEGVGFLLRTESCRSISNLCLLGSLVFLVAHELEFASLFLGFAPSMATPIVLAIIGVGLRVVAVDRFLRMAHQKDYEAKHPNINE